MDKFHEILQKKIIEEFKLRIEQSISKEEFYEMYNRAKELYEEETKEKFLTQRKFAEEYLQLTTSAYKMVRGGYQKAKILKDYVVEDEQIQELRKKIIYEEKLHRGDLKTYNELLEYYNKYFIPFMEKDFFEKILDVSSACLKNIKPKTSKKSHEESSEENSEEKEKKTGIIKKQIVTDEEIEEVRKKVLREELLHKDNKITYKEFLEIYKKHFIPLSEEEFAKRILDINNKGYTKIKFYPDTGAIILSTIKIPENIEQIREEIIRKERLHREDEIPYSRFKEILDNNYLPISIKDYSDLILDISYDSLRGAKYDENRNMGILSKQKYPLKEEIQYIRKKVIHAYKLHKGDKLTYSQFLNIYNDERFYMSLSEKEFAKEIFDVELNSIKYSDDVSILKNEVVHKEEIEELREEILKEFKIGQKINYDELEYIYNKYYIRLSIKEYADRVLDIKSIKDLKNKKYKFKDPNNPEKTIIKRMRTMIFLGDEVEKLKNNVVISNILYDGMEITREHFMKLYQNYPHALSYLMFGKLILGINIYDTNALILGRNRKVRISTNLHPDINESNKKRFIKNQEDRIEELLYDGKLPTEISEELMISQYDIDEKINSVTLSRKVDENVVKKSRVKRKLFSDIKLYKIAIQLHMNIEEVKKISKLIISEEIQRYINEDQLTFDEAVQEIQKRLLAVRKKEIKEEPEKTLQTKAEIKENKNRKVLTARAKRISNQYEGKTKQKESLNEYINLCRNDIEEGKFDKANIDVLEQAILFLDKDDENIEFFIRYCISQEEYKRANGFLAYYLNDYSIEYLEKQKLRILYNEIKIARERSEATKLIRKGNIKKEDIINSTNISITNVISIERELKEKALEEIISELI